MKKKQQTKMENKNKEFFGKKEKQKKVFLTSMVKHETLNSSSLLVIFIIDVLGSVRVLLFLPTNL